MLATHVDPDISIYDADICKYDAGSPTMLSLQPRGDPNISIYGADICIYDAWSLTMHGVAISECKQRWHLTKVMIESERMNFPQSMFLGRKRKVEHWLQFPQMAAKLGVERWHKSTGEEEVPAYKAGEFD